MIYLLDRNGFFLEALDAISLPGVPFTKVPLPEDALQEGFAWKFNGGSWAQVSTRVFSPRMTHLYFLSRFTPQERLAIRAGTATDPILDDAMFMFNQAKNIDVELPLTQQLVGYLVQQGYLAPERITTLLARAPLGEDGVLE
jgi:hypothetical protein